MLLCDVYQCSVNNYLKKTKRQPTNLEVDDEMGMLRDGVKIKLRLLLPKKPSPNHEKCRKKNMKIFFF